MPWREVYSDAPGIDGNQMLPMSDKGINFVNGRCATEPPTARSQMTPTAAATSGLKRKQALHLFGLAATFSMTPQPSPLATACMVNITQGGLESKFKQICWTGAPACHLRNQQSARMWLWRPMQERRSAGTVQR